MKNSVVAKRYARAIFGSLNESEAQIVSKELASAYIVLASDGVLKGFLTNPTISRDQKSQIVTVLADQLKMAAATKEILNLLNEKGRMLFAGDIAEELQHLRDQKDGIHRGVVRSATPLSAEIRSQIESRLKGLTGKNILMSYKEDKSLIGGLVAEVGGLTLDDSLVTHMKKLKEELNRSNT